MEETRVYKWDNVKFILILAVVLGHCIDTFHFTDDYPLFRSIFIFLYSFHMPAFMFLSGLFSKKTVDSLKFSKTLPYLFAYFLTVILIAVSDSIANGTRAFKVISFSGLPWFMLAVFFMFLITMAFRNISPAYVIAFSMVAALAAGFNGADNDLFSWMRVVYFYPFFYLGYLFDPVSLANRINKRSLKAVSVVIILAFLMLCLLLPDKLYWFRYLLTGRNGYSVLRISTRFIPLMPLVRLAVMTVSALLCAALFCVVPNKKLFITKPGSRTLAVYIFHGVAVRLLFGKAELMELFKKVTDDQNLLFLFVFLTALVITAVFSIPIFDSLVRKIFVVGKRSKKEG